MSEYHIGRKIRWVLCFVAVAVLFSGISAYAFWRGKVTKFTADQVMISAKGKILHKGKIYVTPNKMRIEGLSPQGKGNIIMIYLKDKHIGYYLNPEKKLYMEKPPNEKEMEQNAKKFVDSKNEKVLGTEYINGYKCTKKEVETTVNYMGYKSTSKTIAWISKKLGMPIRTQSQNGSIMELRNIKEQSTPNKYFEVPKGYKQVSNMIALMGINMEELNTGGSKMDQSNTESSKPAGEDKESVSQFPFKLPKGLKGLFK
jgi:outer membrane lipoprotein-sorting protein